MNEVVKDEKVIKQLGWDWSANQKRLVKRNIEPIVYDGKQMYTDGFITTDNFAILANAKYYEICPIVCDQDPSKFKKEIVQKMSVLHSDIAFVGSDGKVHLIEENIKTDYNEWNW